MISFQSHADGDGERAGKQVMLFQDFWRNEPRRGMNGPTCTRFKRRGNDSVS